MNAPLNQTSFMQDSMLQPESAIETTAASKVPEPTKKSRFILAVLATVLALVLGLVVAFLVARYRFTSPATLPTPLPTATASPIETSTIKTEIAPFLKYIEEHNPEFSEHPFPPIDTRIRLPDPF